MELKKSPEVDLEKNRGIYLQIGFVVSLAIVLIAFEWTSSKGEVAGLGNLGDMAIEEEIIPITRQEEVKPPPPPPPPKVTEVLNIVEDDVEIEDELEIEESEADEETQIEMVDMDDEEDAAEDQVFFIVEDMPQFPGGDAALQNYIATHVVYPEIAKENGITGRVFVRFEVNRKGKVDKVSVVRGVDPSLDKAAIDVIKQLPDWSPGKQRGKPVNVWYTAPINFVLN
ncbi:MAG: energy transducer TonB [Chlorobi bacterium]|nr:energy transducer TonB [Chlorobiota bacterium]